MIAGIVLATLTSVTACTQLVHGQCQSLMRLDTQCTERHGAGDEMLNDAFNRLNLFNRCGLSGFLEAEEVANEDG